MMGSVHGFRRPVKPKIDGEHEEINSAGGFKDVGRTSGTLDAASVLRLQRTAGNSAVADVLQRKATKKRSGASHVGAVEEGFDIDSVAPGEGGFSSRMLAESGEMAETLRKTGGLDNLTLKQVAPDVAGVAAQERAVGQAKSLWEEKVSGWSVASTNAYYQLWADGCQRWLDHVAEDKRKLQMYGQSFNAFVPRANSFAVSAGRLSSMQALLGATDNYSLVAAIQEGLADAQQVAAKYRDAMEGSDAKSGPENLDVPTQDNTVQAQAGEVTLATKGLNEGYLGFRIAMTGQEKQDVENEGAADNARMTEINQVKTFIRQVGGAIDSSMAVVSGAPAAVTNVTNTLRQTEAKIKGTLNRRAVMRGERGTHNATYLTTNPEGEMVVADAQTGMQRGADGEKTAIVETGITLPTSVENILGGITDFIYADEVREINIRLQGIANRVSAIDGWAKGAEITRAIMAFQNRLNEFAKACNDLQQRIAARRNAYLNFGVQLDRFARANKDLAKEGLSTGKSQERYSSIMTVAGQIREVLALGRNAAGGFGSAQDFAIWVAEAAERRESSAAFSHRKSPMSDPKYWVVPAYHFTPGEENAIGSIFTQARSHEQAIALTQEIFGPVDTAAVELFTNSRVSPGGGSGKY